MAERLASISIDLDGLRHYEALHGLPSESDSAVVAKEAPGRLAELLDSFGAKATFFAIGEETASDGPLRALAAGGHEIGNHTLSHPYGLTRLPHEELRRQVAQGASALEAATGVRPVGFRAPGYTLSADLLAAVAASGHRYDSSVFPAAPYYAAKAAALSLLRLRGRASVAILDRPRVLMAPLLPYHPAPAEPYARGGGGLLELPISVTPWLRIPFFGTAIVQLPIGVVRALYRSLRRQPVLNLELHGVDLLGPSDGMSKAVARAQPDLRVSASDKVRRLREVFRWIAGDYQLVPLREMADAWSAP